MTKTHWKQLQNPNYLGAYSLPNGEDMPVQIEKVIKEQVKSEGGKSDECTVAYMKNQKPMILNVTNCKMITKIVGSPYIENWIGVKITLYVSKTKLKGEDVECLRIREVLPVKGKAELTPKHIKWIGAKKAIKEGTYTIDKLQSQFEISKENLILLNEDV